MQYLTLHGPVTRWVLKESAAYMQRRQMKAIARRNELRRRYKLGSKQRL